MTEENTPIDRLGLKVASYDFLRKHSINTFGELCALTETSLREMGANQVVLRDLRRLLKEHDLALKK